MTKPELFQNNYIPLNGFLTINRNYINLEKKSKFQMGFEPKTLLCHFYIKYSSLEIAKDNS